MARFDVNCLLLLAAAQEVGRHKKVRFNARTFRVATMLVISARNTLARQPLPSPIHPLLSVLNPLHPSTKWQQSCQGSASFESKILSEVFTMFPLVIFMQLLY